MEESWPGLCASFERIARLYSDGERVASEIASHPLVAISSDIRKFCEREVRQLLKLSARLYEHAVSLLASRHDLEKALQVVEAEVVTRVENLRSFRNLLNAPEVDAGPNCAGNRSSLSLDVEPGGFSPLQKRPRAGSQFHAPPRGDEQVRAVRRIRISTI